MAKLIRPSVFAGVCTISALVLAGCNGHLYTSDIDPLHWMPTKTVEGVVAYRPIRVVEVSRFTQYDAGDKKPPTSDCLEPGFEIKKVTTVADLEHPIEVRFHPGLLEATQFSAAFAADGTLQSVNSQATPDQGKTVENLTSAAANLAKFGAAAVKPPPVASGPSRSLCNVTPTFMRYEAAPRIE